MEVILLESIHKLGNRGQAVKVKPGYARNYLFPRKLALPATPANRRVYQENERMLVKKDVAAAETARVRAAKLADVAVNIAVQVGEEDKLYGSVTSTRHHPQAQGAGPRGRSPRSRAGRPIKAIGEYSVDCACIAT